MESTLLLDTAAWDLVLDANGTSAVANEPYALAQDAASAIKTFLGECYWDTTIGIPYLTEILAKNPSIALLKATFVAAALTVPDVASAECFLTSITARGVAGQVQVRSAARKAAFMIFSMRSRGFISSPLCTRLSALNSEPRLYRDYPRLSKAEIRWLMSSLF